MKNCEDRARLVWNDVNSSINLHLPAISNNKLPATWSLGKLKRQASTSPDVFPVNSEAFAGSLSLILSSANRKEQIQRLHGLSPWGLFEKGGFAVNPNRKVLPLRSYTLMSVNPIEQISREGFDNDETLLNEPFRIKDGSTCYITELFPSPKNQIATLSFNCGKIKKIVKFYNK